MSPKNWIQINYPSESANPLRFSKYHPEKDIWFFTFPTSYLNEEKAGYINMLLQLEFKKDEFHYLKVPFSFFRKNKNEFAIRSSRDKFDLHISAKKNNWLICERSRGVNFREFEQKKAFNT